MHLSKKEKEKRDWTILVVVAIVGAFLTIAFPPFPFLFLLVCIPIGIVRRAQGKHKQ